MNIVRRSVGAKAVVVCAAALFVAVGWASGAPIAPDSIEGDSVMSLRCTADYAPPEQAGSGEGAQFEDADTPGYCPKCGGPGWLCSGHPASGDWGGLRKEMKDEGVNLSFILTTGFFQNFRGGLNTHNANQFSGDWRMNLLLDFDKMGYIPGGFFFIRGKSSFNRGVNSDVGALGPQQWVYGSGGWEEDEELYIDKWWYGQKFFEDRFEMRVGKLLTPVDLFDRAAYAKLPWDQFSNAALCRNPTVPHRKALGTYAKFQLCDVSDLRIAVVDADNRDNTECADIDEAFHGQARYIGLLEYNIRPKFSSANGDLPGNYGFGLWYDGRTRNRYIDNLGGLLADRPKGGHYGWYLTFDQLLYKENADAGDKQGLGTFFRYGFAHPEFNPINHFWSIGAQYQGLFANRDKDTLGFGIAQSIMSKTLRHNVNRWMDRETVYELYYAYHLSCWCVITPDIQLITNPGGDERARDALVGGVRVKISF